VKISAMLTGDILFRCAKNWFSQGRTFSAIGSQTCEKNRKFNRRNSKPEVDIDVVPTAFMTFWIALK